MGLFDQILSAIDNPNQQASPNQLGNILGAVEQLSGNQGIDAGTTQLAMSVLGGTRAIGIAKRAIAVRRRTSSTTCQPI
ncbi:hypothetical protein [Microcoleus vaginatus]|uniref:hypothetical protein n=1 Tax=Microcoleus vaginatus TaxID=119532 RepID=UPI00403F6FE2